MKWFEKLFRRYKEKPSERRINESNLSSETTIVASGTPVSSSQKASTKSPTTENIQCPSEAGKYYPVCLVCGNKIEPIEDFGLAMQVGHIICPSCGEDYSYSLIDDSLTVRRTLIPRGWTGPVERSYSRVQMRKPQPQPEPSTQKTDQEEPFDQLAEDLARAEGALSNSKWDEAIRLFTKVITASPANASALFGRARCYEWKDDLSNALHDIDVALEIEPRNARFWHLRGFIYARMKDYGKAIVEATKALELSPDDYDAYYLRGRSYYELDRYEESLNDFTKCKEIKPNILNPDEFIEQIKVARAPHFKTVQTANPEEAVQVLEKALSIVPASSMENIQKAYGGCQRAWQSNGLVTGNFEQTQSIVLKNLVAYASRKDFQTFRIWFNPAKDFAEIEVLFPDYAIPIRVWRSHDCFCSCGSSSFMQ